MEMTVFETYLRAYVGITSDETGRILSVAMPRSLRRNELLLQEGQVCRHKTFVGKGLMRIYGTVADGSEHILQFAPENTWVLDGESYDQQKPATFNIAAVEPSEVLCWTKSDFDILLTEIPALSTFSRQLVTRNSHNSRQRLFSVLSGTPEDKYKEFVNHYPDLLSRLPLHMIAAYLGISLKTLTRIRHAQMNG